MGFLARLFRQHVTSPARSEDELPAGQPPASQTSIGPGPAAFAVIDAETTGLAPRWDRLLELAIVRCDQHGRVLDQWVSRFNPDGPVGATHIHGITAADVARAPRFGELIPEVNVRLAGAAVVAHNAAFDLAFLRTEYARAGWALPSLPTLCTLDASRYYLPSLDRRRLPDCCRAVGIQLTGAHSALGDARATAALLARFLDPRCMPPPLADYQDLPQRAADVVWPNRPGTVRDAPPASPSPRRRLPTRPVTVTLMSQLEALSLADVLDEGAPAGSESYLELLAQVLEDGEISQDEAAALEQLAESYESSTDDRRAAHRSFLTALAHLAVDDGTITRAERAELETIAGLLGVDTQFIREFLEQAAAARTARLNNGLKPLPHDWSAGEPLRVGDKVAFTGCDPAQRELLETKAKRVGVRVMGNVSPRTAMLVTDGQCTGTKAEAAARLGTRTVSPDTFDMLLTYLQPTRNHPHSTPQSSAAAATAPLPGTFPPEQVTPLRPTATVPPPYPVSVAVKPADIRTWARQNGYPVGVRGRLGSDILGAYHAAHT